MTTDVEKINELLNRDKSRQEMFEELLNNPEKLRHSNLSKKELKQLSRLRITKNQILKDNIYLRNQITQSKIRLMRKQLEDTIKANTYQLNLEDQKGNGVDKDRNIKELKSEFHLLRNELKELLKHEGTLEALGVFLPSGYL